jgi:7-carboxy-7-deazaguanine synthase
MVVTEIFRSIQGEGTRAGLPCIFVRLTGCNLRCVWCDTAYAFYGGTRQTVDEVMQRVREFSLGATPPAGNGRGEPFRGAKRIELVEITGGEPLLQPEVIPLASRLLAEGFTVMIETSGERYVGSLPREVIKIVDVKCPDSGEGGTFDMANLAALDEKDEIKFVITSRRDFEFAREFTTAHELDQRVRQVIFSPAHADPAGKWPGLEARELAEWILAEGLPVRLGLQLHKFIWAADARGV